MPEVGQLAAHAGGIVEGADQQEAALEDCEELIGE